MGDCTPKPNQETENINHGEFEDAIEAGHVVLLQDKRYPGGRFQTGAAIMGGDVSLIIWHDPKEDGNWHTCGGTILYEGFLPKIAEHLEKHGFDSGVQIKK